MRLMRICTAVMVLAAVTAIGAQAPASRGPLPRPTHKPHPARPRNFNGAPPW